MAFSNVVKVGFKPTTGLARHVHFVCDKYKGSYNTPDHFCEKKADQNAIKLALRHQKVLIFLQKSKEFNFRTSELQCSRGVNYGITC